MSHSDGERTGSERLASEIRIKTSKLVLVKLMELGPEVFFSVHDILAKDILGNDLDDELAFDRYREGINSHQHQPQ